MRTEPVVEGVKTDVDRCEVRSVDPQKIAQGRRMLLPDETYFALAEGFRALADASRAKIVFSLLQLELCVCDLAAVVGQSESAVSQHLRVLRGLHLVKSRREGKAVYYALDDDHIRALLNLSLQHLRHTAEAAPPATPGGEI